MIDLSGQKALVTGATGAIGGAIATLLHSLGAHVIISGTSKNSLEKLAENLKHNYTMKLCNLNDQLACADLIKDIDQLDILICNAGITRDNLLIKMTNEMFDEVLNINLRVNFILNREAVKKMLKNRYGRIVNIASVVAVQGNSGQANYCASKAGLIGMTKSIAQEIAAKGITANLVAPGFIESNMTDKLTIEQQAAIAQKIPAKAFGTPKDVANAVAFLASKEASYITGQTLHINGGMLMV